MTVAIPSLPGVLSAGDVAATAAAIARVQEGSGAVPWFPGGPVDPWDHVECAMGLLAGGEPAAAERAWTWLFDSQRADGTWPIRFRAGAVEDGGADSNMCAYVAVGVWHHWLVVRDRDFLRRAWPVVRRALGHVTSLQLRFGGIAWAQDARGRPADTALVAGSSSTLQSLCCGVTLAEVVGDPQPEWELAAGRLRHALGCHEDLFQPKARYSMDWYYPVLAGSVRGPAARGRLSARWQHFVVPGLGVRCVEDHPWVTGAETCELALAMDAVGQYGNARALLQDMQHLRDPDGTYWTGYVYPDHARWPEETSTWTAAAVILAVDALSRTTPGSGLFRQAAPPSRLTEPGPGCDCATRPASAHGVSGVAANPDEDAHGTKSALRDEVSALDRT